jgi:hypothetical protein
MKFNSQSNLVMYNKIKNKIQEIIVELFKFYFWGLKIKKK